MQINLLSGFLGSGKTTAIQHACELLLQQQKKVGVITNDQGIRLVDTNFFKSLNIPNKQVINGCFCCNYHMLDKSILELIKENDTNIIFAESVGSCTDIVATVMKPLLKHKPGAQITVSTFADARLLYMLLNINTTLFDETVNYIYYKQLEEAGIIVINKVDAITAKELKEIQKQMPEKYPDKILLYQNSLDNKSVEHWLQTLNIPLSSLPHSLDIDYDIYGAAESMLAWLDEEVEIISNNNNAQQIALQLIENIYKAIQEQRYTIGHLKFLIDDETKISYTALSQPGLPEVKSKQKATLLINARVQTSPELLQSLVTKAIMQTEENTNTQIMVSRIDAFKPGYPKPTYRIASYY